MKLDEHQRRELAAWLEFYRELGIEDFYRHVPGAGTSAAGAGLTRSATTIGDAGARSIDASRRSTRHESAVAPPPVGPPASGSVSSEPQPRPIAMKPPVSEGAGLQSGTGSSLRPPVPAREMSLFEAPAPRRTGPETLEQIREDLGDCHRCKLAAGRKTIVFGEGNPHAALVFVGEGPGADEDQQGRPFVGRAGQLLNRMIQMIGMKREDVYICNIVKCRPPGNRTPEKDEVETCSPFLFRQLEAIRPRLVCCLGAPAVKTVLGIKEGITRIRGQFYDYGGAKALATVHPAYILRNPREERILREDFEKIREFLKSAP